MAVDRRDFERAVAEYWGVRDTQGENSKLKDVEGAGTAGKVRGGQHFDPIALLLKQFFLDAGYPDNAVRVTVSDRLELPGYYRPQKRWDVVVTYEDTLVAAFELKALGGPSFGNNYNNRVEEALGSAVDVRRARLAELYPGERPWLGYFFIMEDDKGSRSSVALDRGAFPVEDIWLDDCCLAAGGKPCGLPKRKTLHGKSYQERFAIFCERLLEEQLYDAACYITSSAADPTPTELAASLDWQHFAAAVTARITYLHELGIPKPQTSDGALFGDSSQG
ncbi:PaeR7I family type II restriction endonuclease [Streptomyces luteireticuli]|uniref:PaeR7I family type II restriction endonuclease n=1 Tax=Streptomyces luteireticuli TaxID=173858 RepID=A0ABN0YNX3_9ACTN